MRLGRHNQVPRCRCGYAAVSPEVASVLSISDSARCLPPESSIPVAFCMTTFRVRSQALRRVLLDASSSQAVPRMSAPARRELSVRLRGGYGAEGRRSWGCAKRERWITGCGWKVR
jgi:hypothetical protein